MHHWFATNTVKSRPKACCHRKTMAANTPLPTTGTQNTSPTYKHSMKHVCIKNQTKLHTILGT